MAKNLQIDFVSDVSCPWCAVGLASLQRALDRIGNAIAVELRFQPFELNPDMPPERDAQQAQTILESDDYAQAVRAQEQFYLRHGIHSVPAVVINGRYLISGGRSPEVFEQALPEIAAA